MRRLSDVDLQPKPQPQTSPSRANSSNSPFNICMSLVHERSVSDARTNRDLYLSNSLIKRIQAPNAAKPPAHVAIRHLQTQGKVSPSWHNLYEILS